MYIQTALEITEKYLAHQVKQPFLNLRIQNTFFLNLLKPDLLFIFVIKAFENKQSNVRENN